MIKNVVVDANVLAHTQNPRETHHRDAVTFCEALDACSTELFVDTGQKIAQEYLTNLSPGSVGFATLANLAAAGRLKEISDTVPRNDHQRIFKLVPGNARDRTYVRVAYNTSERVLTSNDLDDFDPRTRKGLLSAVGVTVLLCGQAISRL
jgi:hypothetical protein